MRDERPKNRSEPRRIQSIEVGFRLIRALERSEGFLPLREIAALAGMPPSKAYLYLVSFVREGLVAQDSATGHYGLGPFATQLGLSAIRQLDVINFAKDEVIRIRDATQCAAYLSVWGGRGPTIAVKADGARQGSMAIRIGYVLPLLYTATGRVFLTYMPSRDTDAVLADEASTVNTLVSPTALRSRQRSPAAIIAEVRRNGYASSDDQLINLGFVAHSAPIFDYTSQIVATLTVLGPNVAAANLDRATILKELLATTGRVSAKLGCPPSVKAEQAPSTTGSRKNIKRR